jgi:hypothetical protein
MTNTGDYELLFLGRLPICKGIRFLVPGVDVSSRDSHAVPYVHENYMKIWRQMEMLVQMGLVWPIGTSNMPVP